MGYQPRFPAEKLQVGARLSISSVVMQTRGDTQPGLRSGLVGLQKPVSLTTGLAAFPRASSLKERLRTRASAHPSLALTARGPLTLPCGLQLRWTRAQLSSKHPEAPVSTSRPGRWLLDRVSRGQATTPSLRSSSQVRTQMQPPRRGPPARK